MFSSVTLTQALEADKNTDAESTLLATPASNIAALW